MKKILHWKIWGWIVAINGILKVDYNQLSNLDLALAITSWLALFVLIVELIVRKTSRTVV